MTRYRSRYQRQNLPEDKLLSRERRARKAELRRKLGDIDVKGHVEPVQAHEPEK